MPRTLAIARLWYEGSSFTPVPTRLTRFHEREWSEGDAAVAFYRETRTELGAAVDFLETQTDANRWRGRWLRCCAASPGGPVVEEDLQGIIAGIVRGIEEAAADAVYLSLHGALLGEVGASFLVKLGGRLTPIYGKPVELDVSVERLTDGRYRNRGPMEAGLLVNLGRTAVLRHGELRVVVSEACHAPNDAAYFALHGVELAQVDLLAVKAKNHFRAAFTALTETIVDADTPGPAMADLSGLPFRNLLPELYAGIGMKGPTPA